MFSKNVASSHQRVRFSRPCIACQSDGEAALEDETPPDDDMSGEMLTDNQDNHVDPEEDARTSPFAELCVAQSAAALWGRRIVSVTTSDSAAFAVSELGEVRFEMHSVFAVVLRIRALVVKRIHGNMERVRRLRRGGGVGVIALRICALLLSLLSY